MTRAPSLPLLLTTKNSLTWIRSARTSPRLSTLATTLMPAVSPAAILTGVSRFSTGWIIVAPTRLTPAKLERAPPGPGLSRASAPWTTACVPWSWEESMRSRLLRRCLVHGSGLVPPLPPGSLSKDLCKLKEFEWVSLAWLESKPCIPKFENYYNCDNNNVDHLWSTFPETRSTQSARTLLKHSIQKC